MIVLETSTHSYLFDQAFPTQFYVDFCLSIGLDFFNRKDVLYFGTPKDKPLNSNYTPINVA